MYAGVDRGGGSRGGCGGRSKDPVGGRSNGPGGGGRFMKRRRSGSADLCAAKVFGQGVEF